MKFFNRYLFGYAAIVLLSSLFYFSFVKWLLMQGNGSNAADWGYLVYLVIVFFSALIIGRKDEYHGFAGLNYHFTTYIITNGVPILFAVCNVFNKKIISNVLTIMGFWGIGLVFHLAIFWFFFRKKTIRSYEKEDIFQ